MESVLGTVIDSCSDIKKMDIKSDFNLLLKKSIVKDSSVLDYIDSAYVQVHNNKMYNILLYKSQKKYVIDSTCALLRVDSLTSEVSNQK